jgi:diguanylate cyclase (GGDEF)-like protein
LNPSSLLPVARHARTASPDVTCGEVGSLLLDDLLGRQPLLALINTVVAVLAATVISGSGRNLAVLTWLGLFLLAQAARVALWLGVRRRASAIAPRLAAWLTLTSGLAGLAWGAAGVLFGGDAGPVQAVFVPFVLAGMAAGSITALPGHPAAFFTFLWAALLPYALTLAASPDAVGRAMALLALLYAIGLSVVGAQVHRTLRRAAELHLQNASLVGRLDEARQGLEATVADRTVELRAANEALSREVAERRRSEERVNHLLAHDPLTGLPNRLLLFDRLSQALTRSQRFGTRTALMVFDIDRFKDINDGYGHPAGDRLLRDLAQRVREVIRATDTAARLGGDEFALVAPDLTDRQQPLLLAQRLMEACRPAFDLGEGRLPVSISLGAALFPDYAQDADSLLRAADLALYAAKAGGRDRFVLYSETLQAIQQDRRRLEVELRRAPERGQLRLAYQPRFALADRRLMAVEALLRWDHPEFGRLPTDRFIAVAEASGLIREIGRWVLDTACEQSRRWRDAGRPIRVAVNLSAVELRQRNLLAGIRRSLDRTGLEPALLELEITESACMERDGDAIESGIADVKRLGVRLAIDDFGTGYSSLAYLKWLPFDVLKVDRSFVRNLGEDARDEAIVTTIITLARQLDKIVVAEGVESPRQLETLRRLGCHEAQGYLLGRPAPPEAIDALLAA